MTTTKLLDPRDKKVERNLKLANSDIEEVRLFDDFDLRLVRIEKNFTCSFQIKAY